MQLGMQPTSLLVMSLLLFCLLIQQGDQKSFLIETKDKVAEKKFPKVTSSEVAPTEVTTPNAAKPKRRRTTTTKPSPVPTEEV